MPIYDWMMKTVTQRPNHPFLYFENSIWNYQESDQIVSKISNAMFEFGVQKGDRVAVFMENRPEALFCYLACFRIGAICVSINHRFKSEEFIGVIDLISPKLLMTQDILYARIADHHQRMSSIKNVIVTGNHTPYKNVFSYEGVVQKSRELDSHRLEISDTDIALILQTSGSTAISKIVTHSHHNLIKNGEYLSHEYQMDQTSRYLFSKNLGYMSCFGMSLAPILYSGGSLVLLPKINANTILETVKKHQVTHTHIAPITMVDIIHEAKNKKIDFSSIVCCTLGGDSIPEALYNEFNSLITNKLIINCGMTECAAYAHTMMGHTYHFGLIGKPFPGMSTQVQDKHGRKTKPNEHGEFCVKSDMRFVGYWNNPKANEAAFQNGWFKTGDLGYYDEDGNLWFVDRIKNIIICGNSNVSPLEIESVLHAHSAVNQVCVVGVPSKIVGENIIAFVTLHNGHHLKEADLIAYANQQLSDYKVPKRILILEEMPFTASGKVDRKALKKRGALL